MPSSSAQWEYLVEICTARVMDANYQRVDVQKAFTKWLNAKAAKGWELVHTSEWQVVMDQQMHPGGFALGDPYATNERIREVVLRRAK